MSGLETDAQFQPLILILGAGEIASGIAYRLVKAGLQVVMTELAHPSMARMCVSYGSSIQHRAVIIEGIIARRASLEDVPTRLSDGVIPVLVDPDARSIQVLRPAVLIDTLRPGTHPRITLSDAPLVIGLRPGFTPRRDCHAVIEINPGHFLGRVFWENSADTSVSIDNKEVVEECLLSAPADGEVVQTKVIGCFVTAGMVIARVGGLPVIAPVDGVVRGLIDDDVHVTAGSKIGDLDPFIKREHCFMVSDKALAIGGGAVEAVLSIPHIRQMLSVRLMTPAEQAAS